MSHKIPGGKSLFLYSFLFRTIAISVPVSFATKFGPMLFKGESLAHFTPTQVLITKILVSSLGALALVAIFRPRFFIKPLFGALIFAYAAFTLKGMNLRGAAGEVMSLTVFYSAALACAYCCAYDSVVFLHGIYQKLHRRFTPIKATNWGGVEYQNTKEKGDALERYVCEVYRRIYGNAMTTDEMKRKGLIKAGPGDQGADVVVRLPDGRRLIIQCKNYSSPLGNDAVQEITTARAHYNADQLAIIAPNGFTSQCIDLARSNSAYYGVKIDLIDGSGLGDLIKRANGKVA